jgi:membrane protein YqaA with SNARE-associated domain
MVKYLRRRLADLKSWIEHFATRPYALVAMFLIAFGEAAFFPFPPDLLLCTMGVVQPRKATLYGIITATGSVAGGYLGYFLGAFFFSLVGEPILSFLGMLGKFNAALAFYHAHGVLALMVSGFIPIPYIAFTMAAGFNHTLDLATLTAGALVGRFVRFGLLGVLLSYFGMPVKTFIDKYFERLSIVFAVAVVVLIVVVKLFL